MDDLKQRLIDVWTGIQQSVIYNAIEWHRRLRTCIQAIGGHFDTHCDSLNSKKISSLVIFVKIIVNQLHCFRLFIVIDIHISQGSLATHFRCGGIFNDFCIASFLLSLMVKEF